MAGLATSAIGLLARPVTYLALQTSPYTWPYILSAARSTIISILSRIETGQLVIREADGTVTVCGAASSPRTGAKKEDIGQGGSAAPYVELTVKKSVFWVRMLVFADLGFSESYMLGEVDCSSLTSFFELFIANRSALGNATTFFSSAVAPVRRLFRKTNTLTNARLHIAAHYDISNDMFAAFLSPDMTYSCPIWRSLAQKEAAEESLEEAQMRKLTYAIEQAHIKSTDHVLEIGTGWGSFSILAVQKTGCRVTSLTLSKEQKALAEERIAMAGLTDRIEILLCDYRSLPTPASGKLYDKVVSIEMLESVGAEFLDTYFDCINQLLKPDGGIGVFQCITIPEARYEVYASTEDFINKYIFPSGHLPTNSQLVASIDRASKHALIVDEIKNIGGHYAKTLRLWGEQFEANFESVIKPTLLRDYVGMTAQDVELFRRKWHYYFTYCEAGFKTKTLGDVIITVAREGATEMLEDIPL